MAICAERVAGVMAELAGDENHGAALVKQEGCERVPQIIPAGAVEARSVERGHEYVRTPEGVPGPRSAGERPRPRFTPLPARAAHGRVERNGCRPPGRDFRCGTLGISTNPLRSEKTALHPRRARESPPR